ncbi:hypothetical protein [Sphingobacterium mizutaii]|uniref:hypothetical protein n=1 Tax=Sphingobacterium mizutaii TaxID=1010 RepID=UPI003D965ADC
MFLKLFQPIFDALNKDMKLTLLAILLASLLYWGGSGEYRLRKAEANCRAEEIRKDSIISLKDKQLDDV